MEHRTIWERVFGDCAIRVCSCGSHYLFIGKACLLMDAAHLDRMKLLMGSWGKPEDRERELVGVVRAFGHPREIPLEPWTGPLADKSPCVN